jgi:hypothetical protein
VNGTLTVREEIHGLIDNMPERNLYALRPLLDVLVNEPDDDTLSQDELASFLACEVDIKERPKSFVSIAEYKKRRGLA